MCILCSQHGISDGNSGDRLVEEKKESTWIVRRKLGPEQNESMEGIVKVGSLELPKLILRAFASREEIQREVKAAEAQLSARSRGFGSELSAIPILRGNSKLGASESLSVLPRRTSFAKDPHVQWASDDSMQAGTIELVNSNTTGKELVDQRNVTGSSGSPFDSLPKVRPPETRIPNCQLCPAPVVPQFCSFAPHPLAQLESLLKLDQGTVSRFSWSSQALAALDPATASQAPFEPPPEEVRSTVGQLLDQWQSPLSSCGIWTRDCVRRHLSGELLPNIPTGPERCFVENELPKGKNIDQVLQLFPDLKEGVFGSCAVVAVSHNLLGKGRGPEIDAHDTVFR